MKMRKKTTTTVSSLLQLTEDPRYLEIVFWMGTLNVRHISFVFEGAGKEYVPVPLGKSIYRRDREETKEDYCRLMLVLFQALETHCRS